MLTQSQIQGFTNIGTLLSTATDCLCFVTEFFEILSKAGPHIYHSALQLAPQLSIVWKLYGKQIYSPRSKVMAGIPASWDLCTAIAGSVQQNACAVWFPCGQFIAVTLGVTIQVLDSNTLEKASVLKPPCSLQGVIPVSLTFSPDGCLLACFYSNE